MKAPRVVSLDQYIESSRTGKLQLAATAKASPTMKATFCFSNAMPRMIATMPRMTVAIFETRISSVSVALAAGEDRGVEVVAHGRGAGQREAGDDGQDGGEGHGRDEAEEERPPTASARWMAAMLVPPRRLVSLL